jgi:MFS family permease
MIGRRLVFGLGLSQLLCWGISYYLIGVLGDEMATDLGWPKTLVYAGFSGALVVMGLTSGFVGRLIDAHGGRRVMAGGSLLMALGCAGLGLSHDLLVYDVSWACLGLAMRMTLYDAAFATLARIGGHGSRQAMAQITLLGGLASTAFWPIGHTLSLVVGWRGTVFCYAAIALLTIPLHLAIPKGRYVPERSAPVAAPLAEGRGSRVFAGVVYMLMITLVSFLNAAMSAHMIGMLSALGLGASMAVWLSSLRGIGQSAARLGSIVFGQRLHPTGLAVLSSAIVPVGFAVGLFAGGTITGGVIFALSYGVGNGLLTIVRGTLPLVLFDQRAYGATVGRLIMPSFIVAATGPFLYAAIIEAGGSAVAMAVSLVLAGSTFACALILRWRFR